MHSEKISNFLKRFVFVPAIMIVIVLLFVAITDRYIMGGGLGFVWVEELCVIITFWIIFLSIAFIDREDLHIKVRLIFLSPKWAEVIEDLSTAAFLIFLMWSTSQLWPNLYSHYAALEWSMKVGYLAIIVGAGIALVSKTAKWGVRLWRRFRC